LESPLIRRPLAGGSQRPDAPPMEPCRYSDIGRAPKPSVIRVTPIKRGSRQTLSQNWKDTSRTDLPKPKRPVWEDRQNRRKIKVNKWRVALPRGLEPLFSP
jgi:hypothetical protein